MKAGKKKAKEVIRPKPKFSLEEAIPGLLCDEFAHKPKQQVRVVVVDSNYEDMNGMVNIMLEWKNIFVVEIHLASVRYPDIDWKTDDIVLLSEDMGEMTGTRIAENLLKDGFPGLLASTAPGDVCPPVFKHHFGHKRLIAKSYKAAAKFVFWMSSLLEEVERDRGV